jgi:hypothetical protein
MTLSVSKQYTSSVVGSMDDWWKGEDLRVIGCDLIETLAQNSPGGTEETQGKAQSE